jgi:hypothetical protein
MMTMMTTYFVIWSGRRAGGTYSAGKRGNTLSLFKVEKRPILYLTIGFDASRSKPGGGRQGVFGYVSKNWKIVLQPSVTLEDCAMIATKYAV